VLQSDLKPNAVRLTKLGCSIFLWSHFAGALWFCVGRVEKFPQGDQWIPPPSLRDADGLDQYILACYWGFVAMTGVGPGVNTPEVGLSTPLTRALLGRVDTRVVTALTLVSLPSVVTECRYRRRQLYRWRQQPARWHRLLRAGMLPHHLLFSSRAAALARSLVLRPPRTDTTASCTPPAHRLHTACTPPAHRLHTACTPPAHRLHTARRRARGRHARSPGSRTSWRCW
jgi:hypothetical protein